MSTAEATLPTAISAGERAAAPEVSTLRLYLLRAMYLVIAVGLAATIWPLLLGYSRAPELMRGVVWSMLAAVSLLAALGLRYPLKMLPLLFFELVWKGAWLLLIALPTWRAGEMDARTFQTVQDTALAVIILAVVPWGYVYRHYVQAPADRWR